MPRPTCRLVYYSARESGWCVEGGIDRIEAAASSRNVRLSVEVELEDDPSRTPLTAQFSLDEWLNHPFGGSLLGRAFASGAGDGHSAPRLLDDPAIRRMALQIPLTALVEFPGGSLTPETLAVLVQEAAVAEAAACQEAAAAKSRPKAPKRSTCGMTSRARRRLHLDRREVLPSVEHRCNKGLNNRAEYSHQPTRQRERAMKGFRTVGAAQRFLAAFSGISPHFRSRRHLLTAPGHRLEMTVRFTIWDQIAGVAGLPAGA
ncbi:DDE-type integrase/transposase/recombinase [Streptomyces sp. NPDC005500]|uniref:DDE-type integrase/transposase/recombinase n=1 Tax=Streptomyces sp. NPDC005500 TaxID=3155007 RepID=UPI0033ACDABB